MVASAHLYANCYYISISLRFSKHGTACEDHTQRREVKAKGMKGDDTRRMGHYRHRRVNELASMGGTGTCGVTEKCMREIELWIYTTIQTFGQTP